MVGSSRHVILANHTQDILVFSLRDKKGRRLSGPERADDATLFPFESNAAVTPSRVIRLHLCLGKGEDSRKVSLELKLNVKTWGTVSTSHDIPWRLYILRMFSDGYKVLIIPKRDMSKFLSTIPDHVPLSSVLLPGTHDSMAFYGWPISQCQSLSTPLMTQLHSGIRFLDIRLSVIGGRLVAYHGIYPQRESFEKILFTIYSFLSAPPWSETVIVSIKQEDFQETPSEQFSHLVRDEINDSAGGFDMWFLENRIPKLGEVRGKAIMFSRFGGNGHGWEGNRLGIHPSRWPNSEKFGFTWQCEDMMVRTHDWYNISSFLSIPEKVTLAIQNMVISDAEPKSAPILPLTFFSAASFPLAFPTVIARGFGWPGWGLGVEGVNSRLGRWLLEEMDKDKREEGRKIGGWVLLDFYGEPELLVPLLIESNYLRE